MAYSERGLKKFQVHWLQEWLYQWDAVVPETILVIKSLVTILSISNNCLWWYTIKLSFNIGFSLTLWNGYRGVFV